MSELDTNITVSPDGHGGFIVTKQVLHVRGEYQTVVDYDVQFFDTREEADAYAKELEAE